jgi:hypothetical protein
LADVAPRIPAESSTSKGRVRIDADRRPRGYEVPLILIKGVAR